MTTATGLIKFDQARQALMEAKTVDEVKEIRDKAEALRLYAKQQGFGLEMQNDCAEIKIRAERRMGALIREMRESGQLATNGGDRKSVQHDTELKLPQLGIGYDLSRRCQLIEYLPELIFDEEIATVKGKKQELTSSRLLKVARRIEAKDNKLNPSPLTGKYRVFYADPPWKYGDSGLDDYGHAERHYPPMTIQELCDLGDDIREISENDAVLYLWVTSPMLEDSFKAIRAWGFEYKASFVWDKVRHNHGHYNSVRHEFLLICTRGSCVPDVYELIDSVQSIERGQTHSEKPEAFRKIIDTNYPRGERIELFARKQTENWETWGNEPATA